ncbi:MAG TPA: response regulator [Gammaproteobacteria bacterium]
MTVEHTDDTVSISVRDTGVGIDAAKLAGVFELFMQVEPHGRRAQGGLGIGLTLVKRLVEMHGGTVEAHSEGPGRGSEFVIRFPAIPAPENAAPGSATGPVEIRELRKVLLIEDNEDARHALSTVLRHYGFRTFAAADGLEGIAVADEVQPDAAIIDIGLPQYDGFEVARRLRARTGGERMLLVALTGYSSREARRQAMEAGFDEYLVKPVSPVDLAGLIESRLQPAALTG